LGSAASAQDEGIPADIEATLTTYNWGSPEEGEVYAAAFDRLTEMFPNVTVEDNVVPVTSWADYADQLARQVAAGNPPDIINIAIEGVRLAVANDLLVPLTECVAGDETLQGIVAEIPPAILEAMTVDGELYLLPYNWQTMVVYYNPKLFDEKGVAYPEAGWTRDEFLETAIAMTDDDTFGFGQAQWFFQTSPWWLINGASPVSGDLSTPTLTDPAFVEGVQFVGDLINLHKVAPSPIGTDVWDLFANGRLAMTGAGRWVINGWNAAGFDDYEAVPWPVNETGDTVFGTAGWGISSQSPNPELACEAIKQLSSEETIAGLAAIGQGLPVLPSVAASPEYQDSSRVAQLLWEQKDNAKPVSAPAFFNDLERTTMRAVERVFSGEVTAEEALTEAQAELESALN
jgi:multiple sugar transport system substrate-binding protein